MTQVFDIVRTWLQRWNERYALSQLSERQLRDVGLDRDRVSRESTKLFWRE